MTLKDLNQESDKESLKKYTDEIELNEKHLSLIYDTLSDAIYLLAVEPDDCFRFVSVNQAFLAVTGLTREQVVGKRIEQVLPETAHALVISKYKEAIVDNKTVFWEQASTFPTGEFVGAVAVTPVYNAEGVRPHLVGSVHDLTETRRAKEALRESEARFRNMLENVPGVSVQGYGPDGTVHYWNKASETVYGYTKEEAIGKNLIDLIIPPEMKNAVREDIRHGARTGEMPPPSELLLLHKDGFLVPIFSSHVAVKQPGREPEIFCMDINLTERKQAEKELQKRMNELETFYRTTLGREERVIELKQEVNELLEQLGKNKKYADYSK